MIDELFNEENTKIENITSSGEIVESNLSAKPVVMTKASWEDFSAKLDLLDEAEETVNIKPVYFSFEKEGDSVRGFFQGFTTIETDEKVLNCAKLMTKQGILLFAQSSIVSQLKTREIGEAFSIKYTGTDKTKSGYKVQIYEIKSLAI